MSKKIKCILCKTPMIKKISSWSYYCNACDYWYADFDPNKEQIIHEDLYTEEDHSNISALEDIRLMNFNLILNTIRKKTIKSSKLLDVGCASGLFLKTAMKKNFDVYGIEPNINLYNYSKKITKNTKLGFFPDSLHKNELFDVITFNDVLEHIPDIERIINGCKKHLNQNGIVVINIPNSNGVLFKLAKVLHKFRISGPWDRLWQKMFYTPHLHYFNPESLSKLMIKNGFLPYCETISLQSFNLNNLWERLSSDKTQNIAKKTFYFFAINLSFPIIKIFKSDSFFQIYQINNSKN